MTTDQMEFWSAACQSANATAIRHSSLATAAVMSDKESSKRVNKSLDQMSGTLTKYLLRKK